MLRPALLALALALALASSLTACDKDETSCDSDGALQCNGEVLEECADGTWEESEDCAAADMICHDMGDDSHCMDEGDMEM